MATIFGLLEMLNEIGEQENVPIEKAGKVIANWERRKAAEKMTREEKTEARTSIVEVANEFWAANPDGDLTDLDPREVAQRAGLPNKQGARSVVRHQLKVLQIAHQSADTKAAAD